MTSSSLAAITSLKKLVNHPDLVFPACRSVQHRMSCSYLPYLEQLKKSICRERKEGFETALEHFPPGYDPEKSNKLRPELSGKLTVLDCLLAVVKSSSSDKASWSPTTPRHLTCLRTSATCGTTATSGWTVQ